MMIRPVKILSVLLILFSSVYGQGDVTISFNNSSCELCGLHELNDFTIINSGSEKVVDLEVVLQNSQGEIIFNEKARTNVKAGANSMNIQNYSIEYSSNPVADNFQNNGWLEAGRYTLCVQLAFNSNLESVKKYCHEIVTGRTDDITLIYPLNNLDIETLSPVLQWSSSLGIQTTYRLQLVELFPYSTAQEALVMNPKFLNVDVIGFHFNYPADAPVLSYDRKYAWQVIALNKSGEIVAKSQQWIFTPVNKKQEGVNKFTFTKIHRNVNNGNYLYKGVVGFIYENRTGEDNLDYQILDISDGKYLKGLPLVKLDYGLNKIVVKAEDLNGVKKGHNYQFIVHNKLNEEFKFNFKMGY